MTDQAAARGRRAFLAGGAAALGLGPLVVGRAAAADRRDEAEQGWGGDEERAPLRFMAPDGATLRPKAVRLVGFDGALAASLPKEAAAEADDRLDLSGLGALSGVFAPAPWSASMTPEREIGALYWQDDTLSLDATGWSAAVLGERAAAGFAILSRARRGGTVVALRPNVAFARAARDAAASGARVGSGYAAANGGLLLAPPRRTLYGVGVF